MTNQLKIHINQAGQATLDELVNDIRLIWSAKDAQRTIYDTLLHTVNHASKLGEQVRRGEYQAVLDELANTVMWFLTFFGKLQQPIEERHKSSNEERLFYTPLSLSDIVWNKYPYTCPACYFKLSKEGKQNQAWKRQCDCLLKPGITENRTEVEKASAEESLRQLAKEHEGEKVTSLDELEKMFSFLYEANYENLSLESVAFHLMEEVGEVSDALIRLYSYNISKTPNPVEVCRLRRQNLESEIADTISWIFGLAIRVKRLYVVYDKLPNRVGYGPDFPEYTPRAQRISLANILWTQYGDRNTGFLYCPACGQPICNCKLRFYKSGKRIAALFPRLAQFT